MKALRSRFLFDDSEIHYKYYDRKTSLNLVINSKDEIITSHRNKIQFYSNELYILRVLEYLYMQPFDYMLIIS